MPLDISMESKTIHVICHYKTERKSTVTIPKGSFTVKSSEVPKKEDE